jgi:hypothetical protein
VRGQHVTTLGSLRPDNEAAQPLVSLTPIRDDKNGRRRRLATVNPLQVQGFLKSVQYPGSNGDIPRTAEEQGTEEHTWVAQESLRHQEIETPAASSEASGTNDE